MNWQRKVYFSRIFDPLEWHPMVAIPLLRCCRRLYGRRPR